MFLNKSSDILQNKQIIIWTNDDPFYWSAATG